MVQKSRLSRHDLRLKGNICEFVSPVLSGGPGYRAGMAQWLTYPPLMLKVMDLRRGWLIPKTIIKMLQTASMLRTRALGLEFDNAD